MSDDDFNNIGFTFVKSIVRDRCIPPNEPMAKILELLEENWGRIPVEALAVEKVIAPLLHSMVRGTDTGGMGS